MVAHYLLLNSANDEVQLTEEGLIFFGTLCIVFVIGIVIKQIINKIKDK